MKIAKIIFLSSALLLAFALPVLNSAQSADDPKNLQTCPFDTLEKCQEWTLGQVGGKAGYGTQTNVQASDLANRVGKVIGMVLSVFGVVFLALVVYSGIQWMSAGGNEEKVTKARERIVRAAVGLGIVMMSYALTSFIVARMQEGGGEQPNLNYCHQNTILEDCANDRYGGRACWWSDTGPGTPGVCCNEDEDPGEGRCTR